MWDRSHGMQERDIWRRFWKIAHPSYCQWFRTFILKSRSCNKQQCTTHSKAHQHTIQMSWSYNWGITRCEKKSVCNDGSFWPERLYLTITPDHECSFQVRLYANPNNKVQIHDVNLIFSYLIFHCSISCFCTFQHDLPNICNDQEWKVESDFKQHIWTKYPGACYLEYQQVIEIFIDCMLQWDSKKKQPQVRGIFGRVIAFAPAQEEQGWKILH